MGEEDRGQGTGGGGQQPPPAQEGSISKNASHRVGWWGRRLPAGEGKRKLVHAGMGLFALALPFLTWQQAALCAVAAFLFNWLVLPRLLGHRLISARPGVSDRGVLLYPLVVLALIVLYRPHLGLAAFGWGVLAFGDAAAGVIGQKWGRHPLPWNPSKTCEGSIAFALSAGLSGAALCSWKMAMQVPHNTGMGISTPFPDFLQFPLLLLAPIVLATILESLPHGFDDNLLPAIAGTFPLVLLLEFGAELFGAPLPDWGLCLGVNTACAVIALTTRALQPGGVAVAWALGIGTWMAFGRPAFTLLLAFLLAGLLVTFLGYGRKHQAGVAEARGGRRGAAEVFGKGGALLLLSLSAIAVRSVDYHHQAQFPRWGWVVVAILAAATADTWATELGGLWGKRAYTLCPVREVPPGTSGAVSVAGLLAALVGAALISGLGLWLGLLAQRPLTFAVLCTLAAFVATVVESLLPRLGPASHVGKNLVVTLLAPILVYAVLGVLR